MQYYDICFNKRENMDNLAYEYIQYPQLKKGDKIKWINNVQYYVENEDLQNYAQYSTDRRVQNDNHPLNTLQNGKLNTNKISTNVFNSSQIQNMPSQVVNGTQSPSRNVEYFNSTQIPTPTPSSAPYATW